MIGSVRPSRQSHKPAEALATLLHKQGIEPILLDLLQLDLPMFADDISSASAQTLLETYKQMDGMILVSPEYNHSIPACVKNAIDFARQKELAEIPLAIATTSIGPLGGARALEAIRQSWFGVRGIVIPPFLQVPFVADFNAEAPDEAWIRNAEAFLVGATRWFSIIKEGKHLVD